MQKDKKIIVTGGLGFIGSHIVERSSQDNDATIIDDASSGSLDNSRHLPGERITMVNGSVSELNLKKFLRGNDYVFHEAARPKFITAMLCGGRPVVYGDGEQSRDFTFIRPVVDANMLACEHGLSGVHHPGCGRRITLNRLIDMINDIMGTRTKPIIWMPGREILCTPWPVSTGQECPASSRKAI